MPKKEADYIWLDGRIVPWEEAKISVASECALRGANVFEGVRAYWNADEEELYVFKWEEHARRLFRSAAIMRLASPFSGPELLQASIDLIRANGFRVNVHFRPVLYFGEGEDLAWEPGRMTTGAFIIALPRPHRPGVSQGIRAGVSTWRRISDTSMPPRVKAGANYHNSRFASVEAGLAGYDAPILLNDRGKVAESSGACLFIVRDGVAITPATTEDILESITRATLVGLFRDELGVAVQEREVDRTELYVADEAFVCGSGWEITPVVSIDHYQLGDGRPGPLTRRIQQLYFSICEGRVPKYRHWLTPVYQPARVG